MEHDEYLQIWSLSPERALACFGFSQLTHEVVVLKYQPENDREKSRYLPEAKLYGIRTRTLTDSGTTLSTIEACRS